MDDFGTGSAHGGRGEGWRRKDSLLGSREVPGKSELRTLRGNTSQQRLGLSTPKSRDVQDRMGSTKRMDGKATLGRVW